MFKTCVCNQQTDHPHMLMRMFNIETYQINIDLQSMGMENSARLQKEIVFNCLDQFFSTKAFDELNCI